MPRLIVWYLRVFFAVLALTALLLNLPNNHSELVGLFVMILAAPLSFLFYDARLHWFAQDWNDALAVMTICALINAAVLYILIRVIEKIGSGSNKR